ncbi:AIPR family protein [Pontibacillus yanchengensis]|uniref:Abortive phage infection protein n=1 Tax=Pontibacillus yanchengensis Y32 TaxID=1385514 RepID=A0A0A2TD02_9BACI|nr:AIPR family protein [Pontibacillus yanchengensis]KGP73722.1 abortive phage infection protein [Pontibacillus yanchengensis Y32]
MITLEEFHEDFLQSILSDSESRGLIKAQSFFELVCEDLMNVGDLTNNYTMAEYIKTGCEVYGYDYDDERKIFTLINFQFFQDETIETLTKQQVNTKFKRLKKFAELSIAGLYNDLEETSDAFSLAYNIYRYVNNRSIDKFRLFILTDGKVTRNIIDIPNDKISGINIEHQIIDIEYIYTIFLSYNGSGSYDIELNIPYLEAGSNSNEYQSYLGIIDGNQLYKIYEEYGQKLLEQNVRTFLQFRGAVNKGIKNTIQYKPDMFFAYNNGITATATQVETKNGYITKVKDFQIVNGGQTTSAIYAAKKNNKLDISNIAVQMKLSVVKNLDKKGEFVSSVSQYANTQNKVNKSDFFSNSPFHKEMKDYSKRIWVSSRGGSQSRTHWFYERVRGEYLNEQAYLTPAKKKQFQIENPKNQLIEKTFLAKCENSWDRKPHIVSKGAQYSFQEFANTISETLEKNKLAVTESYFRNAVSRVILFRKTEKIVSNASWYENAYRAQIVTYSIALLSHAIHEKNVFLDFNSIWGEQELPMDLVNLLEVITKKVHDKITNPPAGVANIGQWCKKEECWQKVRKVDIDIRPIKSFLKNKEEVKYERKEEKQQKELDNGIEIQAFVVQTNIEHWIQLHDYYMSKSNIKSLSMTQRDILRKYSEGVLSIPTEKQSKVLYYLYQKAVKEGWDIV